MSCSSNLPPRSPVQNRSPALDLKSNRLLSQRNFIQEEETLCLDDFLFNSNSKSKGIVSLRRAASDPIELLESGTNDSTCFLDEAFVYGPNSPRQKNDLNCSKSMMATALLENVNGSPCQDLCNNLDSNPNSLQLPCVSQRASRRRSRKRSRAHKLHYISELEKTVSAYEIMEAELAGGIASEFHKRALLSVENKELNQEIRRLQRSKLIKEGQYHYLKNELEKLKMLYVQQSKSSSSLKAGPQIGSYDGSASWQMLDFGKLSLGGIQ